MKTFPALVGDHSDGPSRGKYTLGCRCEGCTEASRLYCWNRRHGIPTPKAWVGSFGQRYAPRIQHPQADWELWDCTPTLAEWKAFRV